MTLRCGVRVPACRIDHITITSPTLEAGRDMVFDCLGLLPQRGGEHPRMGTHNLLLRLGEALFLEVIAVNPNAPRPPRPRWFELDALPSASRPRLACWVVRTDDIHASLQAASVPLGRAETMSRGALEWLISIPPDGHLPLGGAAPALIQWHTSVHPAAGLQDVGGRLTALELLHPEPQVLQAVLGDLRVAEPGVELSVREADSPGLVAHVDTPHGPRRIGAEAPRVAG
jgi:hypothetical protein